jgi:hypothetical protein
MSEGNDWRSEDAYDYINELSADEIAWEFLRRNAIYRKAYLDLLSDGAVTQRAAKEFAAHWGLRFCRRSHPLSLVAVDLLDAAGKPVDDPPSGRTSAIDRSGDQR